ncbi:50S ribosomal protein L11 [Hondaea fermentalgiana]|uniref:Large ribosomal subunit protein uL11m n=1 Tax=Hondaea fermentalgiana TaxID=2315210 RepID=A0A2R5GB72_9STRA|nr:50S ribosomal protein L11 [Hondaea fermentalgiana]|eukprot:GBG28247.1 50S ribosomal protein L11 [Hondaea fermentalgiana]
MSTAVKGIVRLIVPAGAAKPSPAIGQALGPLGVNMMEFCKSFNARTDEFKPEIPLPVVLTAFADRSFEFVAKTPSTSYLLKKAAGIEKGAAEPGTQVVATISVKAVYEVAKIKQTDPGLQDIPLQSICKSVLASAGSMGIKVV